MSGPTIGRPLDDPQAMIDRLAEGTARALPDAEAAGELTVERDRSLRDRMAGRPGRVASVRLAHGTDALTLRLDDGRPAVAEAARISGGVIISRRTMPVGEWLQRYADQVAAIAADRIGDSAAAGRALAALGFAPAGVDVAVDPERIGADLGSLTARLEGRIPPDALDTVGRIVTALQETLASVTGAGDSDAVVRRAATNYLPDTLRAYLALPPEWAATHALPDGSTPLTALMSQLGALEDAVIEMRDAALKKDARALLANGAFLEARFPRWSLDV